MLLNDNDIPVHYAKASQLQGAKDQLERLKKDATEVVGCYLKHLREHSLRSIERSVGAELVSICSFHVVVTLPAIWPAYAQHKMKQAVEAAGILKERSAGTTVLRFISEPEAAALATVKDISKRSTTKVSATIPA